MEYEITNPDGSRGIKYVKASKDEIRALTEIDLMITEICAMQRIKTPNGNTQIKFPANLERKMHDDRAYCLALAASYLSKLRTDERLAKQREANAWKHKYNNSPQTRNIHKGDNPFGNQPNPFGNINGHNPFRS